MYKNTFDAFKTIYSTEGFRGFYKGLGPSLMGVSHVAVQFPLYEKLKVWLSKFNLLNHHLRILISIDIDEK